jgi:hypothetical protein
MENQTRVDGPRSTSIALSLIDFTISRSLACYSVDASVQWQFVGATNGRIFVSGFAGTLAVAKAPGYAHVARVYPTAAAQARMCSSLGPRGGAMTLRADVSATQVAALEEVRNGGDVTFLLELDVEFYDPDDKANVIVQRIQLKLTVAQSHWLKNLERAGYTRTVLIEIPALEEDGDPDHQAALEAFKKSRDLLDRGDYAESVAAARKTLERIEAAEKDKEALDKNKKFNAHLEDMKSWTKLERVQFLRRAARTLTAPAAHGDNEIDWLRREAIAIIQLQSAIIRLVSKA